MYVIEFLRGKSWKQWGDAATSDSSYSHLESNHFFKKKNQKFNRKLENIIELLINESEEQLSSAQAQQNLAEDY